MCFGWYNQLGKAITTLLWHGCCSRRVCGSLSSRGWEEETESGQWAWLGGDERIAQKSGFVVLLLVLRGKIPEWAKICGLSQLVDELLTPSHTAIPKLAIWVNLPKVNSLDLTNLPIPLQIYSWFSLLYYYEYIYCLNIPNLPILIMNTFTEYSQDEYGVECKHTPMNIFMIISFLWMYQKCLHCICKFSHLHWFPLNSCHLFCQHF